ncbi:hypothetical protein CFC35_10030 [Streptomyces sp. FBKL.4005]|nr:hypothetical protein CFC35_10030 [Streptomyces sp. FBKL.4005]
MRVFLREFEGLVPTTDVHPGAVGLAEAAQAVLIESDMPHACQPQRTQVHHRRPRTCWALRSCG